jgi:hypothetical protein
VQYRLLVDVIILVSENRENRHRRLVMLAFSFQRAASQGRRVAAVRYGSNSISMLIRPLRAQLFDTRSPFGTNSVGHTGDVKKRKEPPDRQEGIMEATVQKMAIMTLLMAT